MTDRILTLGKLALLLGILIPASVTDGKKRIIPNRYPVLLGSAGILFLLFDHFLGKTAWDELLFSSGFGVLAALGICGFCRLVDRNGLGMGDCKLLLAESLYLGLLPFLSSVGIAAIASLIAALFLLKKGKRAKETTLPFAPFLSGGAALAQLLDVISVFR